MTTEEAVRIVARFACWALIVAEIADCWASYPDIGKDDWARVVKRAEQLADLARPDADLYHEAYTFLAACAKGKEETTP